MTQSSHPYVSTQEIQKHMYTHTITCLQISIATSFLMAKKRKQLKFPSIGEWIKEMWYIHSLEYYLAIKRNEVVIMLQHG